VSVKLNVVESRQLHVYNGFINILSARDKPVGGTCVEVMGNAVKFIKGKEKWESVLHTLNSLILKLNSLITNSIICTVLQNIIRIIKSRSMR
jgi:hypothetical protein